MQKIKRYLSIARRMDGWCTSEIFAFWIKEILLRYKEEISEKCLLIMDNEPSHISNVSLQLLKDQNIPFIHFPLFH